MKQKFTLNHLLQFIYKETSATESLAIKEALNEDWNLYEQYVEMHDAYKQLPKASFSPSNASIQNILNYSQQTAVTTQH